MGYDEYRDGMISYTMPQVRNPEYPNARLYQAAIPYD
jgi:hypothetical protein